MTYHSAVWRGLRAKFSGRSNDSLREDSQGRGHLSYAWTIRTLICEQGSTINAGYQVRLPDRQTRKIRWELADQDIPYNADELNRRVVVPDQIRTIVRIFRDRLFTEIFPGRTEVPKTLTSGLAVHWNAMRSRQRFQLMCGSSN
jgi:hypothetical protein